MVKNFIEQNPVVFVGFVFVLQVIAIIGVNWKIHLTDEEYLRRYDPVELKYMDNYPLKKVRRRDKRFLVFVVLSMVLEVYFILKRYL